jgi:Fic family protein
MAHRYVWQLPDWPDFAWDSGALLLPLGRTRRAQGKILANAEFFGLELQAEVLTEDASTTAAIEGDKLDWNSVRSSVARRLGLPTAGLSPAERHVDGLVQMLFDATVNHDTVLDGERLKGWQAALFPTGYSGLHRVTVGDWRPPSSDPMRVVSGPLGREKVHYQAPPADRLGQEMERLFEWWRAPDARTDGLIRAALVHLWFVTIHPFEDGNGRIARALADMALARDERTGYRLYSMSAQISNERDAYYDALERTQKGHGDVTEWIAWFLECLERAMHRSDEQVRTALLKARFWQQCATVSLNERQRKVINRLLDAGPGGFQGSLTTRKYCGMTKASRATAKRDMAQLVEKGTLKRNPGGGRGANYDLVWPE